NRLALRHTVARELRTERALWTEVELSSGGDEYTVVGNITRLIGRARRVARSHEVDARILVTVLPGDDARRFVARRGVDRDGDLSVGRDRLADKDAARGNRDTVHPGEQDIAGSQIVCLAVLVLVAEAEGAVRVPLDIHRGQDREGQRAGEGRREGVGVLPIARDRRRRFVVFRLVERGRHPEQDSRPSHRDLVVITLRVDTLPGRRKDEVAAKTVR